MAKTSATTDIWIGPRVFKLSTEDAKNNAVAGFAAAVTNPSRKYRMIGSGFGSSPPIVIDSARRIEFQPMKTSIAP